MKSLTINTDQISGEVDLVFASDLHESDLLDDLHDSVLPSVDGASQNGSVRDFIVSVRHGDFPNVVKRLADTYRARGFAVTVN